MHKLLSRTVFNPDGRLYDFLTSLQLQAWIFWNQATRRPISQLNGRCILFRESFLSGLPRNEIMPPFPPGCLEFSTPQNVHQITFIKYTFTCHFCHLRTAKVKKKKKSVTQINIKERSKYTGVFVTKFKRGFTLPTTFIVTKVDGHEAMVSSI